MDQRQDQLVLAVAEPAHGFVIRRVVAVPTLGQLDAPRGEERADAVAARLAVDVLAVVVRQVEGRELLAGAFGPLAQVLVEHLLPGRRMYLRRLRQDAVEVERQARTPVGRPSTHGE